MMITGQSRKMKVTLGNPIQYQMRLGDELVDMNPLIGREIQLTYAGKINCIVCGRKTKKSFAQGMCFPCMQNSPENSECIIRPELCRGHLGEGRDAEWEKENHVCEHTVYLAISSHVKVGVTRGTQVPTRWIDQGASEARVLFRVPYRALAGEIEVALKSTFSDRTSWQKMLTNRILEDPDWDEALEMAQTGVPDRYHEYWVDEDVLALDYPVETYPEKVKSMSFDKTPVIGGTLMGIKGQYLIFNDNRVLNIRKHNGYELSLEA